MKNKERGECLLKIRKGVSVYGRMGKGESVYGRIGKEDSVY